MSIVRLDDGATTTVESWGEGPVMLCVHGMTSSRKSWQRLARHYASRFRVVAYDQRGHGDSSGVTGPMSLARGVRDLGNVAAALGAPVDVLAGHSWGGAVVIRGGLRLPVARIIAVDPMIRQAEESWYDEYVAELEESFVLTGPARDTRTRDEYAEWSPDDVEGKVHAVHTMTVEPIKRLWSENSIEDWDLRSEIARYDKPLLLAMADRDQSINSEDAIADVIAHHPPQVQIERFSGAGHNLYRTAFDGFVAVADRFLAQTAAVSS